MHPSLEQKPPIWAVPLKPQTQPSTKENTMSFFSEIEKVVSGVGKFFGKLLTQQSWQTVFAASTQALAGTIEGILEATKNAPAASKIQSVVQQILTDLGSLAGLTSSYNSATHTTFVAQVTAILNEVQANLGTILGLIDVKDTSLIATVTEITNMVISGAKALLALVPQTPTAPAATA